MSKLFIDLYYFVKSSFLKIKTVNDDVSYIHVIPTGIGVARGGARGPGPPPIKIPLTTKSYDNVAWRCLVAVFFQ